MITYRPVLDQMAARGCQLCSKGETPGSNHEHKLYLHSKCHPYGRIEVSYHVGVITVACQECHSEILSFEVQ